MSTFTRCSSTPSAETFVKPAGSTKRTRPRSGVPSPQPLMSAHNPGCNFTASVESRSRHDLELIGIADLNERSTSGHGRLALLQYTQYDAVNGGPQRERAAGPC